MKVERRRRKLDVECSVCCLLEKVSNICWNVKIWNAKHNINNKHYVVAVQKMLNSRDFFVSHLQHWMWKGRKRKKWRQNKSKERVEDKKIFQVAILPTASVVERVGKREEKNETKLSACPRRIRKDVCWREMTVTIHREIIKLCCMHSSENGPFPPARHRWVNERIELCESDKLWQPRARHG